MQLALRRRLRLPLRLVCRCGRCVRRSWPSHWAADSEAKIADQAWVRVTCECVGTSGQLVPHFSWRRPGRQPQSFTWRLIAPMDERGFAMPPYGVAADPTPGTRRAPVLGSEIWRSSASACPRLGTCPSATDPADTANCSHFRRETGGRLDGLWSCANCSHTEAAGPIR